MLGWCGRLHGAAGRVVPTPGVKKRLVVARWSEQAAAFPAVRTAGEVPRMPAVRGVYRRLLRLGVGPRRGADRRAPDPSELFK